MAELNLENLNDAFQMLLMGMESVQANTWGSKGLYDDATIIELNVSENGPSSSSITFKFKTNEVMKNVPGNVHGGCATTIADNLSSWTLLADPRYWGKNKPLVQIVIHVSQELGVSRNLNLTFVRPIPIGVDILFKCTLVSSSRRYTYFTFEFTDMQGKQLVIGTHDKAKPATKL
jgi:acyl-coenzyme A thioesterase 13